MVIIGLLLLGLCAGSFVNAFSWRWHEGKNWFNDRSECVYCHHKLASLDLIPVFSWFLLRGRCRYCHKPISIQYPLVEALTAILFVISYLDWPRRLNGSETLIFSLWLVILTCFMILTIYDLRWMLLPDRLVAFAAIFALALSAIRLTQSDHALTDLINLVAAALIGGGLFYSLYQLSQGRWIGGGDVKLGFLLGVIAGTPSRSLLVIFVASIAGCLVGVPLILKKGLTKRSLIPFGPFLIVGSIVVQLYGSAIISWYTNHLLLTG